MLANQEFICGIGLNVAALQDDGTREKDTNKRSIIGCFYKIIQTNWSGFHEKFIK